MNFHAAVKHYKLGSEKKIVEEELVNKWRINVEGLKEHLMKI